MLHFELFIIGLFGRLGDHQLLLLREELCRHKLEACAAPVRELDDSRCVNQVERASQLLLKDL